MSHSNSNIIRAFNEVRTGNAKNPPHAKYGFQTCGIVKGEGRIEEFEAYFNPEKGSHFLAPGDYEVRSTGVYLDKDGRMQMGREFIPVKVTQKAAA